MKVTLVHVGDFKEDYLRAAEREYVRYLAASAAISAAIKALDE